MSETSDCIVFSDAAIKRGDHIIWQHGTFTIPTGSVTAIVGTNGTGKTTMMRAELGLLPLCHGSLTVLGKPAGEMNKRIGYVPQSYVANVDSNLTAEQSVLLGLTGTRFGIHPITKAQKAKALEALEFTGIADKARYRLSELSGGLRQRVAIAQALVCDPQLLMLDEPLANLDLASQRATVHVLAKLNRELNMTIQVVAHDLNMLLPILTGAVYLLDGHPHYADMHKVLDSDLLTHLYGTGYAHGRRSGAIAPSRARQRHQWQRRQQRRESITSSEPTHSPSTDCSSGMEKIQRHEHHQLFV